MIETAAVLAALVTAQKILDSTLVSRMLKNGAKKTANKLDDWIVSIIYGTPEPLLPAALAQAQVVYDATPPAVLAELKAAPSALPWDSSDIQEALGN